jgi:hypothetical protein
MIQKSEHLRSEGFVLGTVAVFDQHFFGKTPEPLDQVQIWSIRRQNLKMQSWLIFQPFVDDLCFEILGVIEKKDDTPDEGGLP